MNKNLYITLSLAFTFLLLTFRWFVGTLVGVEIVKIGFADVRLKVSFIYLFFFCFF